MNSRHRPIAGRGGAQVEAKLGRPSAREFNARYNDAQRSLAMRSQSLLMLVIGVVCTVGWVHADERDLGTYENRLTLLNDPPPLLADYPEFVEPVRELRRYEAPLLVND